MSETHKYQSDRTLLLIICNRLRTLEDAISRNANVGDFENGSHVIAPRVVPDARGDAAQAQQAAEDLLTRIQGREATPMPPNPREVLLTPLITRYEFDLIVTHYCNLELVRTRNTIARGRTGEITARPVQPDNAWWRLESLAPEALAAVQEVIEHKHAEWEAAGTEVEMEAALSLEQLRAVLDASAMRWIAPRPPQTRVEPCPVPFDW